MERAAKQEVHSSSVIDDGPVDVPLASTSSFNSLAANAGDHHLFDVAFAAGQPGQQDSDMLASSVRSRSSSVADLSLTSPSSILNAYQRSPIDQAVPHADYKQVQSIENVTDSTHFWDDDFGADRMSACLVCLHVA